MKTEEIYWNIDVLRTIKSDKVKENSLSEAEMIEIITKANSNKLISLESTDLVVKYINKLFHPEIKYDRWAMKEEFRTMTLDLLGNILEYFNSKLEKNDLIVIPFSLEDIAEGITYCPDRQIAELKKAYSLIKANLKPVSDPIQTLVDNPESVLESDAELDNFIIQKIEFMKERIFELAVSPVISPQNVHVRNYWFYEMRETLGFDFEFQTELGTMYQDPFGGHRGNALHAFFSKFTPKYVINTLTDLINDNKTVVCELMKIIKEDESLSDDEKIAMGLDIEYFTSDKLTEKAIEYILIKKNLLIKNQ